MNLSYSDFIDLCKNKKGLRIQYNFRQETENSDKYYELFAEDGNTKYICYINSSDNASDISDFESNYLNNANQTITKEYAVPKMVKMKGTTSSGIATLICKIPGTIGEDFRYIKGAIGWFDNHNAGDYVKAYLTDEDNISGGGAGEVISSFNDEEVDTENKGWYFPIDNPVIRFEGIETTMKLPSGYDIKIVATKGNKDETGFEEDIFRVNLYWGKRE